MGEKSGGLTNMVIGIVVTVLLIGVFKVAFPDLSQDITGGLQNIITNSLDSEPLAK
jgi:hypothetical protein